MRNKYWQQNGPFESSNWIILSAQSWFSYYSQNVQSALFFLLKETLSMEIRFCCSLLLLFAIEFLGSDVTNQSNRTCARNNRIQKEEEIWEKVYNWHTHTQQENKKVECAYVWGWLECGTIWYNYPHKYFPNLKAKLISIISPSVWCFSLTDFLQGTFSSEHLDTLWTISNKTKKIKGK